MKAAILVLVLGVVAFSPFLWGGQAEAKVRLPQKQNPCVELRLEIDQQGPVDTTAWPRERILLGFFCAHQGDPGPGTNIPGIPPLDPTHVVVLLDHDQKAGD